MHDRATDPALGLNERFWEALTGALLRIDLAAGSNGAAFERMFQFGLGATSPLTIEDGILTSANAAVSPEKFQDAAALVDRHLGIGVRSRRGWEEATFGARGSSVLDIVGSAAAAGAPEELAAAAIGQLFRSRNRKIVSNAIDDLTAIMESVPPALPVFTSVAYALVRPNRLPATSALMLLRPTYLAISELMARQYGVPPNSTDVESEAADAGGAAIVSEVLEAEKAIGAIAFLRPTKLSAAQMRRIRTGLFAHAAGSNWEAFADAINDAARDHPGAITETTKGAYAGSATRSANRPSRRNALPSAAAVARWRGSIRDADSSTWLYLDVRPSAEPGNERTTARLEAIAGQVLGHSPKDGITKTTFSVDLGLQPSATGQYFGYGLNAMVRAVNAPRLLAAIKSGYIPVPGVQTTRQAFVAMSHEDRARILGESGLDGLLVEHGVTDRPTLDRLKLGHDATTDTSATTGTADAPDTSHSPTTPAEARAALSQILREGRDARKIPMTIMASELEMARSTLTAIFSTRIRIPARVTSALAHICGVDEQLVKELNKRGWEQVAAAEAPSIGLANVPRSSVIARQVLAAALRQGLATNEETAEELAAQLGIAKADFGAIHSGTQGPDDELVEAFAGVYGIEIDGLAAVTAKAWGSEHNEPENLAAALRDAAPDAIALTVVTNDATEAMRLGALGHPMSLVITDTAIDAALTGEPAQQRETVLGLARLAEAAHVTLHVLPASRLERTAPNLSPTRTTAFIETSYEGVGELQVTEKVQGVDTQSVKATAQTTRARQLELSYPAPWLTTSQFDGRLLDAGQIRDLLSRHAQQLSAPDWLMEQERRIAGSFDIPFPVEPLPRVNASLVARPGRTHGLHENPGPFLARMEFRRVVQQATLSPDEINVLASQLRDLDIEASPDSVRHWFSGLRRPRDPRSIPVLARALSVDSHTLQRLWERSVNRGQEGRGSGLPREYSLRAAEAEATGIEIAAPYLLPDVLLTDDAARHRLEVLHPDITEEGINNVLAMRHLRHTDLTSRAVPVHVVVGQRALDGLDVLPAPVRQRQLDWLVRMGLQPNVTVQIAPSNVLLLPNSARPTTASATNWYFPSGVAPAATAQEDTRGGVEMINDPKAASQHRVAFAEGAIASYGPAQTPRIVQVAQHALAQRDDVKRSEQPTTVHRSPAVDVRVPSGQPDVPGEARPLPAHEPPGRPAPASSSEPTASLSPSSPGRPTISTVTLPPPPSRMPDRPVIPDERATHPDAAPRRSPEAGVQEIAPPSSPMEAKAPALPPAPLPTVQPPQPPVSVRQPSDAPASIEPNALAPPTPMPSRSPTPTATPVPPDVRPSVPVPPVTPTLAPLPPPSSSPTPPAAVAVGNHDVPAQSEHTTTPPIADPPSRNERRFATIEHAARARAACTC